MTPRIGIDLGGTKLEGVRMNADGTIQARHRVSTPQDDYDATVAAVVTVVAELEETPGSCRVGIGTPGAESLETGLMKNCNSTCLVGRALRADLETALNREIRLANDADCFALSEAIDGVAADAMSVFGVILGTGVGGGLVVRGELVAGPNAIAGEWGHNPMPWPDADEWPGPDCYCGRTGCIETFLSGPGMSLDHERVTGNKRTANDITTRAENGEPEARATVERYATRLGKALASVINIFDPEVIVLGGGLSNVGVWYERVPQLWQRWVLSESVRTRLVPPEHGDASGVRGAAWLWPA